MKRFLMPVAGLVLAAGVLHPAAAEEALSPLVGVWKLQRFDRCAVGGACDAVYGEKPAGYVVYTRGGLFLSQGYGAGRVVSKTPDPTDAERIALFKSMYAWGGSYKVEGNKITADVEIAWTESWRGQRRVATFAVVDGRTLTLESSPFKSPIDGAPIYTRLVLDRVE
jgi:lipocalin-like protein